MIMSKILNFFRRLFHIKPRARMLLARDAEGAPAISNPIFQDPQRLLSPLLESVPATSNNIQASTSRDLANTAKNASLLGLKVLKEAIDGIPVLGPLKASLGAFLKIVETVEQKHTNDDGLQDLDRRVTSLAKIIVEPLSGKQEVEIPSALKTKLSAFSSGIQKIIKGVEQLEHQDYFSATVNANSNNGVLSTLSSKIDELLSDFTLKSHINNDLSEHSEKLRGYVERLPRVPAAYNAKQNYSSGLRRTILRGTAQGTMDAVNDWIDSESGPNVLVLYGLAGVGKSTVAQTIAESRDSSENRGRKLGASFFFVRNVLENSDYFFSTIAFQLAENDRFYISHLGQYLATVLAVDSKPLQVQLQEMIINPMAQIPMSPASRSLIVIDALDECNPYDAQMLLRLLTSNVSKLLPKILITCRLEAHLEEILNEQNNEPDPRCKMIDMMRLIDPNDIHIYIRSELETEEMLKRFKGCEWTATEDNYLTLQDAAGSLFIMASTIVDFIKDKYAYDPMGRLKVLVQDLHDKKSSNTSPYYKLDILYLTILRSSIDETNPDPDQLQWLRVVVGTIVLLQQPLSIPALELLIGSGDFKVHPVIRRLTSVIDRDSALQAPRVYHASFTDFLTDPQRCGHDIRGDNRFYIDVGEHHARIAGRCLDLMIEHLLEPNLLHLNDDDCHKPRSEIAGIDSRVRSAISSELLYACQYWAVHLSRTTQRTLVDKLERLVLNHLLPWIEVLGWANRVADARTALERVLEWTAKNKAPTKLYDLFFDAQRFLHSSYRIISDSPMHTYISALPSAPSKSLIFQTYADKFSSKFPMPVRISKGQPNQWPAELAVLVGHTAEVKDITFSSDGKRLASASEGHTARLWDGITGEQIAELQGHQDTVWSVEFSSDGQRLASASEDNTARLWNGVTGEPIAELQGHRSSVSSVVFSSDGQRLVSVSQDNAVWLWNGVTGKPIAELQGPQDNVEFVEFSLAGTRLASTSSDNVIRLWSIVTGETIAELQGHQDSVRSVELSSDGQRLASASKDSTARLWNGVTGEPIAVLRSHQDLVFSVTFSPDGQRLASASKDSTVRLWNGVTGEPIAELQGHRYSVYSVAFSSDGQRLASASEDATVQLWDGVTGRHIADLQGHDDSVKSVKFSLDGTRLVSTTRLPNTVRLWNGVTGDPITELRGNVKSASCFEVSSDGQRFASVFQLSNIIRLWSDVTAEPIGKQDHRDPVLSVAFSSDGQRYASTSGDNTFRLWNGVTGEPIAELKGHQGSHLSVAFSSDGQRLASATRDNALRLWDGVTGKHIAELQGESRQDYVWFFAFSSDGKRFVSASERDIVKLWDGVTGKLIAELQGHPHPPRHPEFLSNRRQSISLEAEGEPYPSLAGHQGFMRTVAFSSDGRRLASITFPNIVQLWEGVTGERIAKLQGHQDVVFDIEFSSDGQRLASASKDSTVRLWNGVTGEFIAELQSHRDWVLSVAFSSDSQRLASASKDSTVRLWDAAAGGPIAELKGHHDSVYNVLFSSDDKRLISTSADKTVRLWNSLTGSPISEIPSNPDFIETLPYTLPSSRALMLSEPNDAGLRYIFAFKEDPEPLIPLFWIPVWMRVRRWWPFPSGGLFIAGPEGRVYILEPNDI